MSYLPPVLASARGVTLSPIADYATLSSGVRSVVSPSQSSSSLGMGSLRGFDFMALPFVHARCQLDEERRQLDEKCSVLMSEIRETLLANRDQITESQTIYFSPEITHIVLYFLHYFNNLRSLSFEGGLIPRFPEEGLHEHLHTLKITKSRVEDLSSICRLTSLTSLDLSENSFPLIDNTYSKLPPEIGKLNALKKLRCRDSKLGELPLELMKLQLLEELDVTMNMIEIIPPKIFNLSNLKIFDIRGNPISGRPVTPKENAERLTKMSPEERRRIKWVEDGEKEGEKIIHSPNRPPLKFLYTEDLVRTGRSLRPTPPFSPHSPSVFSPPPLSATPSPTVRGATYRLPAPQLPALPSAVSSAAATQAQKRLVHSASPPHLSQDSLPLSINPSFNASEGERKEMPLKGWTSPFPVSAPTTSRIESSRDSLLARQKLHATYNVGIFFTSSEKIWRITPTHPASFEKYQSEALAEKVDTLGIEAFKGDLFLLQTVNLPHLIYAEISRMPDFNVSFLCHFVSIEKLSLFGSHLSTLPAEFSQLKKIRILNLANNKFSVLPKVLLELGQLGELDLTFNHFSDFPQEALLSRSLAQLNLSYNRSLSPDKIPEGVETVARPGLGQRFIPKRGGVLGVSYTFEFTAAIDAVPADVEREQLP